MLLFLYRNITSIKQGNINNRVSNYIRALNIEIKFLKESGGRKYRVFNITKLENYEF